MVNLSLVVGTRNRPEEFRRLVNSVDYHTRVHWEMLVADASDTPIQTLGLPDEVRVVEERPRLGMARGYNRLFEQAQGEWVIWLNDDATVYPDYDVEAIRFMVEHPQIGLGALYYQDILQRRDFHTNICCYGMTYANFGIISRELGNSIGWFDWECCPMYGSDNTIAYRVLLAGKGIAGIPDARIVHHSEDDECRKQNNNNREQDSYSLKNKYGPHLEQMRATYEAARSLVMLPA